MLWGTVLLAGLLVAPPAAGEARVEQYLDQIRDRPGRLLEFVRDLPKGGDLHTHLSGAVPTETLLDFAVRDDLCIDIRDQTASGPDCGPFQRPAADALDDAEFHEEIIRAWSMKNFTTANGESGHDHFFNSFSKFSAATEDKAGMLAVVARRAAAQRVSYLEPLISRQGAAVKAIAKRVAGAEGFKEMREAVLADPDFPATLEAASKETDDDLAATRDLLDCDTPAPHPACRVTIRIDHQVSRATKPENVFVNLVLGFELARVNPMVVGVNLVQPEDLPESLAGYSTHMKMVGYLRGLYPGAHVSLHAGELTAKFAGPQDLSFHIRDAVEVARAERIGHGVDIPAEDLSTDTLDAMAARGVLIEIALTSNCQILEVCTAADHPFPLYRAHDVPATIVTDDEGVSGSDLSHEYLKAVRTFHLTYADLKELAENSLKYSFLDARTQTRLLCEQKAAFRRFESRYGAS